MGEPFNPPAMHHENHWVIHGNVVLAAVTSKRTPPATTLFRIHSSLLSEHSEVFASMFEIPQGGEGDQAEKYEELPFVRLLDSSEEVCGLLDALRDPLPLSMRSSDSDTPFRIRDALHMASKYLMNSLQNNLVRILESEWPLKVEDLETKDQLFLDYLDHKVDGVRVEPRIFPDGWPSHFLPEPAAAIALAEDYNITSILPAAYYDLLRCSPVGNWDTFRWDISEISEASDKPARWKHLSVRSWWKMHRLRYILFKEARNRFAALKGMRPKDCTSTTSEECVTDWVKLVEARADMESGDIFKQLRELRVQVHQSDVICIDCRWEFTDAVKVARNEIWDKIKTVCSSSNLEEEYPITWQS